MGTSRGDNSQRINIQQQKHSNWLWNWYCLSQDWGSDRDWQIQTQVCLGSKFSLSGILWGFSSSLSFYSEFHGGLALRITGLLFSSSYVLTMHFWTHLSSICFGWFRDKGLITRSHSHPLFQCWKIAHSQPWWYDENGGGTRKNMLLTNFPHVFLIPRTIVRSTAF